MNLSSKQSEPHDPQVDALLGEALAASTETPPVDLSQRIMDATLPHLEPTLARTVIARIGRGPLTAMAAMLLAAAWVGILVLTSSITHDAKQIMTVRAGLEQLEQPAVADLPIDQEIQQLATQIQAISDGQFWAQEYAWVDDNILGESLGDDTSLF